MKILFYQWHSFMNKGIEKALTQMQVEYDIFFYQQKEWEKDDGIVGLLEQKIKKTAYDMVLSVNFAPMVSEVCEQNHILYVSWVYDAPIHIRNLCSLKNSYNRIFFFDRIQAAEYQKKGINAFHMPLAADIDTFKGGISGNDYQTDISFVGQLYRTDYAYYCSPLDSYHKGYLDGILNAQMKVYGGYFLGEALNNQLLDELNDIYKKASGGSASISKRELEYMMACEITSRERYVILQLLSKKNQVALYSGEKDERLKDVFQGGYVDYYEKMPEVFKKSRINLNISLKIIQSGIPLRVFDVLGSGGFLLTNYQVEMPELFSLGEDFVVYESIEDLYAKVDFYLRNEGERKKIARHGYETVEKYYTFRQQMEKMLKQAMG